MFLGLVLIVVSGILLLALILVLARGPLSGSSDGDDDDGGVRIPLWDMMAFGATFSHLSEFAAIGMNATTRAAGTPGYQRSLDYVKDALSRTGYECEVQPFTVTLFEHSGDWTLSLIPSGATEVALRYGVDFAGIRYGGNCSTGGCNLGPLAVVDVGGACNAAAWPDMQGKIALFHYNASCELYQVALDLQEKEASAALVASDAGRAGLINSRIRSGNWTPGDTTPFVQMPMLSITYAAGEIVRALGDGVTASMAVQPRLFETETYNLVCDLPEHHAARLDAREVVVVGSHLDSVPAGPGVNDNASGSAVNLALALAVWRNELARLKRRVRFCWWGAEEEGLLGSRYYLRQLPKEEKEAVLFYVNLDMMASINGMREVADAATIADEAVANQSRALQRRLELYFEKIKVPSTTYAMTGGSDYYPFIVDAEHPMPATGLAAGAGALKTMEQRAVFGGSAGAPMDSCYHQACDTLENINKEYLDQFGKATAFLLDDYIYSRKELK